MQDIQEPYNNAEVEQWAKDNQSGLVRETDALGIKRHAYSKSPKALRNSITRTIRKRDGMITRIGYRFNKSGVWSHKGVGRGTPIDRVGQTAREPKRWFDNVLERNLPDLQEIVARNDASYVLNNIRLK
jgi:hypothetical protein